LKPENHEQGKARTFFEIFAEEQKEIEDIRKRVNQLCARQGIEDADVLYLVRKSRDYSYVPAEIFSQRLSPLEALTVFLRDNMGLGLSEIARRLSRDQRTVWTTYRNAMSKQKKLFIPKRSRAPIPLGIFRGRKLSILETAAFYLKRKRGMRLTEISRLMKKDTSTVWTALSRAEKKLDREDRR